MEGPWEERVWNIGPQQGKGLGRGCSWRGKSVQTSLWVLELLFLPSCLLDSTDEDLSVTRPPTCSSLGS